MAAERPASPSSVGQAQPQRLEDSSLPLEGVNVVDGAIVEQSRAREEEDGEDHPRSLQSFALVRRVNTWRDLTSRKALRRLFRRFDANGDGELDSSEFQAAIDSLGLEDPGAASRGLRRIASVVDLERKGFLSEEDFVERISELARHKAQTGRLASLAPSASARNMTFLSSAQAVSVTLLSYGPRTGDVQRARLSIAALTERFVGRKAESAEKKAAAEQQQQQQPHQQEEQAQAQRKLERRVQWYRLRGVSPELVQLLTDHFDLDAAQLGHSLVRQRARVAVLSGEHTRHVVLQWVLPLLSIRNAVEGEVRPYGPLPAGAAPRLGARARSGAPWLNASQATIIAIDDDVVITVEEEPPPKRGARAGAGADAGGDEDDGPVPGGAFAEVESELSEQQLSEFQFGGARFLASQLVREVVDHNYEVRDDLEEWASLLERAMRVEPLSHHVAHLFDLKKVASQVASEIAPLQTALERSAELPALAEEKDFVQAREKCRRMCDEVAQVTARASALAEFYRSQNSDKMNRAIYIMTIVSTLIVPAQLLSSIWGMNFESMSEFKLPHGFLLFYFLALAFTALLVLWVRRMRLIRGFSALCSPED